MTRPTAIIADPDPKAIRHLDRLLEELDGPRVLARCRNFEHSLLVIAEVSPDLLFVDLRLPDRDGLALVEALGEAGGSTQVVVFTDDRHPLAEAVRDSDLIHLRKPLCKTHLRRALDRARVRATAARLTRRPPGPGPGTPPSVRARVKIRQGEELVFLPEHRIDWVEADGNYVKIHAGGETLRARSTLGQFVDRLDPDAFCRSHRSVCVNLDRVERISPWFHGDWSIQLSSGQRVPLSRTYRPDMMRALGVGDGEDGDDRDSTLGTSGAAAIQASISARSAR